MYTFKSYPPGRGTFQFHDLEELISHPQVATFRDLKGFKEFVRGDELLMILQDDKWWVIGSVDDPKILDALPRFEPPSSWIP